MSYFQARLVAMATLLAESAWIYALFGLFGLAMGLDGSPIGWLAVLVVLVTAFVVTRFLQLIMMPMAVVSAVAVLLGAVTLYMTFATQFGNGQGLDLAWVRGISSGAGGKESVSLGDSVFAGDGSIPASIFGAADFSHASAASLVWAGSRLLGPGGLAAWATGDGVFSAVPLRTLTAGRVSVDSMMSWGRASS